MKLKNMTPHDISIVRGVKVVRTIPASGEMIRLETKIVPAGSFNGIPLTRTTFCASTEKPLPPQDGTKYIVSALVKGAFPGRTDFLVPAEMVRDDSGRIIGCQSLGV